MAFNSYNTPPSPAAKAAMTKAKKNFEEAIALLNEKLTPDEVRKVAGKLADSLYAGDRLAWKENRATQEYSARLINNVANGISDDDEAQGDGVPF